MLEQALETRLIGQVGNGVYAIAPPQDSPFPTSTIVSYVVLSDEPIYSLAGASGDSWATCQFRVTGRSQTSVESVTETIRLGWSGYRGTIQGTVIKASLVTEIMDAYSVADDGSDDLNYEGIIKVRILYTEP